MICGPVDVKRMGTGLLECKPAQCLRGFSSPVFGFGRTHILLSCVGLFTLLGLVKG